MASGASAQEGPLVAGFVADGALWIPLLLDSQWPQQARPLMLIIAKIQQFRVFQGFRVKVRGRVRVRDRVRAGVKVRLGFLSGSHIYGFNIQGYCANGLNDDLYGM